MYFPTTHWSELAQASAQGETAARQALEDLCRRYWKPLHRFIQSRGYAEAEAQDLTQDFIVHLMADSTLKRADPLRGKFRSFLCGALLHFLGDEYDRRRALKRGGGLAHFQVREDDGEAVGPDANLMSFDRGWAMAILETALRTTGEQFEAAGEGGQFAVLRQFLPGALEAPTYQAAATELGLSLPAFKSELHRLRQRFKAMVRQEVACTVSVPHEVDEEMEHLQRVLMDKGSDLGASLKPLPTDSE